MMRLAENMPPGGLKDMNQVARPRLCYVVASPMTVKAFLMGHIRAASERYDVTVVANGRAGDFPDHATFPASLVFIPIERSISLGNDLRALWRLHLLFRRQRFDLVHSVSPKAGLLAMLAACLAGVPYRVHTFTGQVWVTRQGWRRQALKLVDHALAVLATDPLVDSPSQRDFLVAEGIASASKFTVIGKGSICGVNPDRFRPDSAMRRYVRSELVIPNESCMILFLGRLNRDKGIMDLANAFSLLASRHSDIELVLVGPDEEGLADDLRRVLPAQRYRHVDFTPVPEHFMAAADIFCLPSYREGFGMVVVEAAASGLPAVASRIYGLTDAIDDRTTGLLFPPGDVAALVVALSLLIADRSLRLAMGKSARSRAMSDFSEEEITRGLMAFYGKMIG